MAGRVTRSSASPKFIMAALAALAMLLLAYPASAQDDDGPPPCTAQNSTRIDIDGVWRSERELIGRCVAISGYRAGDIIFNDQRALYRYFAKRSKLAKGIVGIPYPVHFDQDNSVMRGVYRGRVMSCADDQRDFRKTQRDLARSQSDEIILVHLYGFCAGSAGPALRITDVEEVAAPDMKRLVGDDFRMQLGELIPLDGSTPYQGILRWLTALAVEPGCNLGVATERIPEDGPPEDEGAGFFSPTLGPAQQDKLKIWCGTDQRQMQLFSVSKASWEHEDKSKIDVVICTCTKGDCAGRWPVSLIDTGWNTDRPYLCQRAILSPRISSCDEKDRCEYSDYEYRFQDEYIVGSPIWQQWGFPD